jgi:hypothetical protein
VTVRCLDRPFGLTKHPLYLGPGAPSSVGPTLVDNLRLSNADITDAALNSVWGQFRHCIQRQTWEYLATFFNLILCKMYSAAPCSFHLQLQLNMSSTKKCPFITNMNSALWQSVPVHSANVVNSCTKARRRVLTSTLVYLIGSESSCDLGSETYKLNLKSYIYNYNLILGVCILLRV